MDWQGRKLQELDGYGLGRIHGRIVPGARRCLGPVAAGEFGAVEQPVGLLVERRERGIERRVRHAHGGGDGPAKTRDGAGDDGRDRLTPTLGLDVGIVSAREQHEFLAAEAERKNLRVRLERLGHGFQNGVADDVAVNVVDGLEVVEVEHGERTVAFGAERLVILLEHPPVQQSRQRVAPGQSLEHVGFEARVVSLALDRHEAVRHAKRGEQDFADATDIEQRHGIIGLQRGNQAGGQAHQTDQNHGRVADGLELGGAAAAAQRVDKRQDENDDHRGERRRIQHRLNRAPDEGKCRVRGAEKHRPNGAIDQRLAQARMHAVGFDEAVGEHRAGSDGEAEDHRRHPAQGHCRRIKENDREPRRDHDGQQQGDGEHGMPEHEGLTQDPVESRIEDERHGKHSGKDRQEKQVRPQGDIRWRQIGPLQRHLVAGQIERDNDLCRVAGHRRQRDLEVAATQSAGQFPRRQGGLAHRAVPVDRQQMHGHKRAAP